MLTMVSDNEIGRSIVNYLRSQNIDTNFIGKNDKRTGIYFLQVGSGNRPSKVVYDRSDSAFTNMKILEYCQKSNIIVSYDSNYRAKLWILEEARKVTLEVLPYVNLLSAGILDAENILLMSCDEEDKYEKLKYYYYEINKAYPNIKHIFSSMRVIESSPVNTLHYNVIIIMKESYYHRK